jgi:hypothetical protein
VRVAAYAGAANLNYRQAALAGAAASFFGKKDIAEHAGRRQCPHAFSAKSEVKFEKAAGINERLR